MERVKKHGLCNIPEYKVWLQLRNRCNCKTNLSYKNYGGRGIKVCKSWDEFENFYKDMGARPKGKSLDRIDNNKGYSKENCRWATSKEQMNNTRRTKKIKINNATYTLNELSKKCGVSKKLLAKRIFERGWDISRAIINKSYIGSNQHKTI